MHTRGAVAVVWLWVVHFLDISWTFLGWYSLCLFLIFLLVSNDLVFSNLDTWLVSANYRISFSTSSTSSLRESN